MTSVRNALVVGASALGVIAASLPAEAAPASKSIGGVDYKNIMTVGHHGGGFGGGGFGRGGGGGRHFSGGGWGGGHGGWRGGHGGWGHGGGHYGYYRGHHHGGHGYGYAAAGLFGLAAGAALADPYYGYGGYYDDDYYYDRPAECRVIRRAYDRYGRPIRVIRYRPC